MATKLLLLAAGAACLFARGSLAATPRQPIVVELFTSQACSSCPPADALLAELKRTRPDLLPLDFHVDYWNRTGWADPYSLAAATERQRRYAGVFGGEGVYTPQMVIGGTRQAVGSDSAAVSAAIASVQSSRTQPAPLAVEWKGSRLMVSIGSGQDNATLWLVGFDAQHVTPIGHGENAGRVLTEVNVVRSLQRAGHWHGTPVTIDVAPPLGERGAVLLQANDGRILGASEVPDAR
ncbi:MAG TPA: DUF1223 domain-containing protein [Acetobacteraceae bacterium]|nr:DUF1223 domain-containing protein [Acetobacteraceae bacterium]